MTQATSDPTQVASLLIATGITAGYGKQQVLSDVSIRIAPGEVVGVLGHNGAGKTTLLKALIRMVPLTAGSVEFQGRPVTKLSSVQMVRAGMSITPATTPIFRDLTVFQNLELGASGIKAGRFSGGQQRQLSLGIALMAHPQLMLLDEPSLGISPAVVEKTFATIKELAKARDMSVLIVEQNVKAITSIVDRVYVLRNGSIVLEESGAEAQQRKIWWDLF